MPLIYVLVTLFVVGVILWLINTYGGQIMDAKILKILNIVTVIIVILWLLQAFGVLTYMNRVGVR